MSTLADIIYGSWAITRPMLDAITSAYERHLDHPKIDLRALRGEAEEVLGAAKGSLFSSGPKPYEVVDGVAVLPVTGILAKGMNLVTQICGGTSYTYLSQELQRAMDDPAVSAVVLHVDSPGGSVDGLEQVWNQVFQARDQKPIVSVIDGMACSAAYGIACAAGAVYLTSGLAQTGNIGVVRTHVDRSKANEMAGEVHTDVVAGEYKRIDGSNAPLTEPGLNYIKQDVDYVYTIFLAAVGRHRGVDDLDAVHQNMANGRTYRGQQAIDVGLADGVRSLDQVIAELSTAKDTPKARAGTALSNHNHSKEKSMPITREQLAAEAPELLTALLAEGETKGSASETARVKGCLDASMPGYESQALDFALDGKTQPGAAAQAIIAAQKVDLAKGRAATGKGPDPLAAAGDAEAIEAANRQKEADKKDHPKDAKAQAEDIRNHIAAESAKGRKLTAAQASRELAIKEGE